MKIPRLVIAGTQSGVGKTSITLGVVAALTRRGLRVQTFKVGPDYLDPTYLAMASSRPCYNLDGWMTHHDYVCDLFSRVAADADIAVIEGVMGLFDGADPAGLAGSTAEIARWLDAPVLLVASAHGVGRSFAAAVSGFVRFVPEIQLAGVIANRCGSARHVAGLRTSLAAANLPKLLGAIARGGLPDLSSRHLGLVTADAQRITPAMLDQLADAIESSLDLDQLLATARAAGPVAVPAPLTIAPTTARLGIARDEAFHFYYPDNLDALARQGCELVPFSPLHDPQLPPNLNGLYLGGGYPEAYATQLAANRTMIDSIREFSASHCVIYAECGGLMYLSNGIETLDGTRHSMVGILPAWTRMRSQRKSLGYVTVTLTRNSLWGHAGVPLRGHEFHYSEWIDLPQCPTAYHLDYRRNSPPVGEGYLIGTTLASYAHLHFASCPDATRQFVKSLLSRQP